MTRCSYHLSEVHRAWSNARCTPLSVERRITSWYSKLRRPPPGKRISPQHGKYVPQPFSSRWSDLICRWDMFSIWTSGLLDPRLVAMKRQSFIIQWAFDRTGTYHNDRRSPSSVSLLCRRVSANIRHIRPYLLILLPSRRMRYIYPCAEGGMYHFRSWCCVLDNPHRYSVYRPSSERRVQAKPVPTNMAWSPHPFIAFWLRLVPAVSFYDLHGMVETLWFRVGLMVDPVFVNIDLSRVCKPHGLVLLQHFTNFWYVLFVDV